jgi:hypothetical protein
MFDDMVDLIKTFIILIICFILIVVIASTFSSSSGYLIVGLFIVFGIAIFLTGVKKLFD